MLSRRTFLASTAALATGSLGCSRQPAAGAAPTPTAVPLLYAEHGGIYIEATVHDATRWFVLDTGATHSSLAASFAKELGLPVSSTTSTILGTAGAASARSTRARLSLRGVLDEELPFLVHEFAPLQPGCVGILGYELLERLPFRLRYAARRAEFAAPAPADRRPIALLVADRIPRVRVRVDGEAFELRLDTGATLPPSPAFYLNLAPAQAERLHLHERRPEQVFTASGGGGEQLELPVHRLQLVEIGELRLERPWAIVQPRQGYFADKDAVGFLGNSVLDKLDPWLDYRGGRAVLGAKS